MSAAILRVDGRVAPRTRRLALATVVVLQTAIFLAIVPHHITVIADNNRYEEAGWLLATGHGIALTDAVAGDSEVRRWVCDRHPEACHDGMAPTAMYPPGYQVFVAAVYVITGRSLVALIVMNWVLLLALFALAEALAARLLPPVGYAFVMIVCAVYPFLAEQATTIMSDQLHATLLLAALAALLLMRPGLRRGAVFALCLTWATLTRPYSVLVIPALFLWRPLHRAIDMGLREWSVAAVLGALPLGAWIVRNAYWFGRLIPFSTTGLGAELYGTLYEMRGGDFYSAAGSAGYWNDLMVIGHGDAMAYVSNMALVRVARDGIAADPSGFVLQVLRHAPKLWVTLGRGGQGVSPAWPLLVLFLGGLALLGYLGMWLTRRDARWSALTLTILVYWAFLLPLPGEARRTLPLRLPLLLLAAFTIVRIVERFTPEPARVSS